MESGQTSLVRPRGNSADLDQGPPPQRQRCDRSSSSLIPDEKYCRSDGDCNILVENIFFKIHRYHLSENSSVFQSMFALPSVTVPSPGRDTLNPIILPGDTAAQFRAFLSFSYSNASQLQISRMSVGDMDRLLEMIPFAHKYLLQNCLEWALESMEHILIHSAAVLPASQYPTILQVTTLCTPSNAPICDRICERLRSQWIEHIKTDALPIGPALEAAEMFSLRNFLVELYCVVLDKLAASEEPTAALSGIKPLHQLRIFSGSWFLPRCLMDFATQPRPVITHGTDCYGAVECDEFWDRAWRQAQTRELSRDGDVFKKLDAFKKSVRKSVVEVGLCHGDVVLDTAIAAWKTAISDAFFVVAP
ncbi:hypothetical protein C8R43DRAFT_1008828 [Mycena crocata]|nr:hypothetical protein C8R43DRAFT_1008828 [Mycena crocata]